MYTMKMLPGVILLVSASLFVSGSPAPEKVVFGEPAEARSGSSGPQTVPKNTSSEGSRKARVFAFPSSQQDSRNRQTYVVASPSTAVSSNAYDGTQNRFDILGSSNSATDENRLLSLLPSFGGNGMQVGLDFKLPFFSIPYAKMFSGLAAPLVSGGGFFGSSPTYGESSSSGLASNLLGSGATGGLATAAAMAVTAAMLYPKITSIFSPTDGKGIFRDGNGADDFMQNINSVLSQFNIDGESCMKVALCSLGNTRRRTHQRSSSSTTTPGDIVEDLLNLPSVKNSLAKVGLVQARDFGGTGGDCDYYNQENKCPVAAQTFQNMLSSLG